MPTYVYAELNLLTIQSFVSIFQIFYTIYTILSFPLLPYFDPFIFHKILKPMPTPIFDPLLTQIFHTVYHIIFPMLISSLTVIAVIFCHSIPPIMKNFWITSLVCQK